MEENTPNANQDAVVVKQEEIDATLPGLGFIDDGDIMILQTGDGSIGVDKETGVLAVHGDGATIESIAIVGEMVASGVAETKSVSIEDASQVMSEGK